MKKTYLTAMLCVALCVCAVFFSLGLTACGEKINEYSVEFVIAADENFTKRAKRLTSPTRRRAADILLSAGLRTKRVRRRGYSRLTASIRT